ncbi:DUF692 family protein [Nocardioides sp. ChNu-153]|uniref:multinuclear nonheme iron-dependent oxidase n=1 Tax=unclassified Nocardioides TaxID=2615069 RepID=UPI00240752CD|nr:MULTISPECIES: DUF692 family multinuclear iron-containing protein [unclassified Nocardioides]MDN7121618.1 DUF692 family protein [Nocardioides sp. ChNu-153]
MTVEGDHRAPRGPAGLAGTAVAWRRPIADLLTSWAAAGDLGFTEVVAENVDPRHLPAELLVLRDHGVTVVPHGVTLGIAGADRPDPARLARLAALAEALGSPVVSEHVAFVRAAGTPDALHGDVLEAGHLLPPPRTSDSLDVLVENVRAAQAALPVPLVLENVAALLTWPEDTLDEADFLTALVERTGCRIVLDVANLHASAIARGTDPAADLLRFPLEAVAYVHVAGGVVDANGLYLDTHAHPMTPPVLALVRTLVTAYAERSLPLPGILLEHDEDVTVAAIEGEYAALRAAVATARTGVTA